MTNIPQGANRFVTEAYALKDDKSIVNFYGKWAEEYDEQMLGKDYTSPQDISDLLISHLPQQNCDILDIGCGTGLTGMHVAHCAAGSLDGVDLSAEMVDMAQRRGIYRDLYVADVKQPFDFTHRVYDAVISSGTFTHGHVGTEPVTEIIRVLKPLGLFACTVHFDLWQSKGFEKTFKALTDSAQIKPLSVTKGAFYKNGDIEGWFCLYQKL